MLRRILLTLLFICTLAGLASAVAPVASFMITPTTGSAPLAVNFTDTSTGVPANWSWDFGDGTGSSVQNPSHTYQYPGLYSVTLTVTNGDGSNSYTAYSCIAVAGTSSVITAGLHASINVVSNSNVSFPIAVQFQDASAGSPTSWSWTFGDGATSTNQNPTHTYNATGTYLVTLQVMNGTGASSTAQLNVTPVIAAPRNYSKYIGEIFTPKMSVWDFVLHTKDFYLDFIPSDIFWIVILLIPYITIYNRTNGSMLVNVLFLMTGGIVALVMPAMGGGLAFWAVALGVCGSVYKLFVKD